MGDKTRPLETRPEPGPPPPLQEGDELGNYLVLAHLFTGGMGHIYAAVHQKLKRHVALKVPRTGGVGGEFNRRRLLTEAQFLARVAHVNVVAVYDFAHAGDQLEYLVMELLDGRSLDEILHQTPRLGIPHAIRVVKEMARGLAAFHRAGIYHVDLKPENVMIVTGPLVSKTDKGENWVKLIDLGTARLTYEREQDAELPMVGTPAYLSPEAILGRPVGPRADLYALGIVLYELIAGLHPLPVDDEGDMLVAQVKTHATPLSNCHPEIAAGCRLEQLIDGCLEKRPSQRPGSIIEFLGLLDGAESEWRAHTQQAPESPPPERTKK